MYGTGGVAHVLLVNEHQREYSRRMHGTWLEQDGLDENKQLCLEASNQGGSDGDGCTLVDSGVKLNMSAHQLGALLHTHQTKVAAASK